MFPTLYHAHHTRHMEDLPFWLELARQTGSPILELGCGTGRLLIPIARAGFATYGLDRDMEMLRYMKENMPQELEKVPQVFAADMAAFQLNRQFALIVLPCNTYSTLPAGDRLALLAIVRRHLLPGGRFAASLPNPWLVNRLPARGDSELEETFYHPLDHEPVQVSSAWERTRKQLVIHWHYDHLFPDGRVQRTTIDVLHNLAPFSEYLEEMKTAGFQDLVSYGDFDHSPFTENSPGWIFSASVP